MSKEFGNDFITIVDDDGAEFELELLDTMDYIPEDDPEYGIIILRIVPDEDGMDVFESIDDDDELQDVYEHFSVLLFDDDEDEE